jgi:excisionase family DNA binding protein
MADRCIVSDRVPMLWTLSPGVAFHLARAIRTYRDDARRRYEDVPPELEKIERALSDAATSGHQRPTLADDPRPPEPRLVPHQLTYREAAQRYRTSSRTLRRRVAQGDIPAVRDGGRVFLRVADLDAYFVPEGDPC